MRCHFATLRSSSPRMRGSSTPRPIDSITDVSGILDHPLLRVMTVAGVYKHTSAISRRVSPEVCHQIPALSYQGRREAGRPMRPIATCAEVVGRAHTCCQVTPESPGTPRAMVYGLYVISPVSPALLPPSPAGLTASLTPTSGVSGPYDFAIRFRRSGQERHPRPSPPVPH